MTVVNMSWVSERPSEASSINQALKGLTIHINCLLICVKRSSENHPNHSRRLARKVVYGNQKSLLAWLIGFIFYQIYVFRQSNKALKANYGRDVSSCLSSEMFHAICQKNKCGVYQAVQGGMIDELSQYGLSPLMVAIEEDESLAKLLIDQGADLTFCAEMFPKLMPYPRHFQMNKDLYMKHTAMGVAMGMEEHW